MSTEPTEPQPRQLYMVLSPRSLGYARPAIQSLLANAREPLNLHLITDSAADAIELKQATAQFDPPLNSESGAPSSNNSFVLQNKAGLVTGASTRPGSTITVTAEEELADAEATTFANLPNLRTFRHGHPCWRKITDPLLLSKPGEELVLLDPDLYFPNHFTFEQTPAAGLLLMYQGPNCLLPPEVVRAAFEAEIKLARHVDIGVSHWRANSDLEWIDWLIGKLGGKDLPRMMHVEAIVWSAIAMREGGGYLDPDLWVCWRRTQTKRIRQKLGASPNSILHSEPWQTMKCFHAGGEAKWWIPTYNKLPAPAAIDQSGKVTPYLELTRQQYEKEQTIKSTIRKLGYYKLFKG